MADAFGLGVRHRAPPTSSTDADAWQWGQSLGGSLGHKQDSAARKASWCVLGTVAAVVCVCWVASALGVAWPQASPRDYIVRAPEVAHVYHPVGPEPLQPVRLANGELADSMDRKMHARLRRAMDRTCRGHANASGATPAYLMATEFVLRSDNDANEIVRHFGFRMGCVCRFNACLWLEDPVVMQQNEHQQVTFLCSDTVRENAPPVKTIRALPYKVVNSDGRDFVARTVEEVCQVGMMVDVLGGER